MVGLFLVALFIWLNVTVVHCTPRSSQAHVRSDAHAIGDALDLYRLEHGDYPENLGDLLGDEVSSRILREFPVDPWGFPYSYERVPSGYRLATFGADGLPGGKDEDADWIWIRS